MVVESGQKSSSSHLESTIRRLDKKINGIGHSMDSSKDKIDLRMKDVNQNLDDLKAEVTSLKRDLANSNKLRALEWALDHTDIGSFEYKYKPGGVSVSYESQKFVRDVIISFRTGHGTFLDEHYYFSDTSYGGSQNPTFEEKKAFRDKLSAQIHQLTGRKSRLEKKEDGRYVIYYS